MMRAIEIKAPGGPEVLTLTQRPMPEPKPGEILIKVAAAGVNRPDMLQRMGHYPPPPGASDLPGLEVSGTVEDANGAAFETGQRVMALLPGGGYAEYAVVDARHVLPVPDSVSLEAAAGIPETLYTVWTNVFEAGALKSGERLLVHGATSGIGTMAASLATAFGATIYGTAGSDDKCTRAEELGFTKVWNYKSADWAAEMKEAGGVDVVLDMIGGDYVIKNVSLLRSGGRHVSIAFLGGMTGCFNVMEVMRGGLTLTGSTLRARDADEKARLTEALAHHVSPKLASGEVAPVVDRTFPLAEVADAHRLMESSTHVGKIVLTLS